MKKTKRMLSLLMVILFLFAGCVAKEDVVELPSLDGSSWVLVAIRKSKPIPDTTITIEFSQGELNGSSGCNSYFGVYEAENGMISVSQLAMTEMACMQPEGVMDQEQEYLQYLAAVDHFSIEGDVLSLIRPDRETLTFQRIEKP